MGTPRTGSTAKNPQSKNSQRVARRTAENMTPEMKRKRDIYVDALLRGASKREAALVAGVSPRTALKEGCMWFNEPYVVERFARLREALDEAQLLTRKELILNIKSIAIDEYVQDSARVAASALLSKIMGFDAPTKVEVNASGVMVVPGVASVDEWETTAQAQQQQLTTDAAEKG
ncbi:terminase small subunit [Microcystis phage Me-ZS1]|nr:terminase small subunit [Microcystis phage Me-ZS1]